MPPPCHLRLWCAGLSLLLCLSASAADNPRVEALRAILPYSCQLGGTGSMRPHYTKGDTIRVEAKPYAALKVGDQVIFWPESRPHPIFHRLVGRFGPLWETQGTNRLTNHRRDPFYCTPSNYIGVVLRR